MTEWIEVLLLAIIEGITEFLPISSTGHMLIAQNWFEHKQSELFLAVVQSGAVLAVMLVFTQRVRQMVTQWREPETRDFILKLGLAFMVSAIGGLALKKAGFKLPKDVVPVALATLVGGILIIAIEKGFRRPATHSQITWKLAALIGGAQLLAVIFPGLSRSGTTIMMAFALGASRVAATEFSFLLGIPTLLSAAALEVVSAIREPGAPAIDWAMLLWGTIVAAVTAFAAVKWLLKFLQSHTFIPFGWYRIALGLILLFVLVQN